MVNIKNLDPNKIKINENSYKNIFIKNISYVTANSVKPLHLAYIINEINGLIKENRNKYLTIATTKKLLL